MQHIMEKLSTILTKGFIVFLIGIAGTIPLFSQTVSVKATGFPPNASAGLDVDFTNLGFLIPRLALSGTTSFSPLTEHIAGMIVYNTETSGDVIPAFYFNDGIKWIPGTLPGTAAGAMQYWNGTAWASVSGGIAGQYLSMGAGSVPVWSGNVSGFPTMTTNQPTAIMSVSATSGGNITNNGGTAVSARGVCWGTSPNPTIALLTKTSDGSGTGTFTSSITGLITGTIYYVRAYATNSLGTEYGNQVTFTTN